MQCFLKDRLIQILGLFLILLLFHSCRNDNFYEGDIQLGYSVDTLRFDTVFTTLGSATRFVKLYNPHSETVKISSVSLESGQSSFFRMNIDGASGKSLTDIEILANDSIYVFVEVTIDPNNPVTYSPFVIEDRMLINTSSGEQFVRLEAWGQNAVYMGLAGDFEDFNCQGGEIVWDDPRPYVIYGVLVINDCTLVWPPGTQIYVHGGVVNNQFGIYNDGVILVDSTGTLIANGTLQDTIVVQGDRLEASFQDDAGQYQGIRFLPDSQGELSHLTIKNSIFGVWADSVSTVKIDHAKIFNTSSVGLVALHANVDMSNTLIHSNGSHAVQCTYGGNYNFDYCTLASYSNDREAIRMDNYLCRDQFCFEVTTNALNITIDNSIIVGSQADELFMDDISNGAPGLYNYNFRNNIVRVDTLLDTPVFGTFFNNCIDCINVNSASNDTLFVDVDNLDFRLDTMSLAEERALVLNGIDDDLDGNLRSNVNPDIGCYEFQQ